MNTKEEINQLQKIYSGLGHQRVCINGKKIYIQSFSTKEVCTLDDIISVSLKEPEGLKAGRVIFKTSYQVIEVRFRKDLEEFKELYGVIKGNKNTKNISDEFDDDISQDDLSCDYIDSPGKDNLNKCLLISLILGVAYVIYSIVYWSGAIGSGANAAEQIGTGIASMLVMPHIAFVVLAVIFNALALFVKKQGFALTGAILYSVALVLFPLYFIFVIIQMILSYIGFAKSKKQIA